MKEITALLTELAGGLYDEQLKKIYVDEAFLPCQKARYEKTIRKYTKSHI